MTKRTYWHVALVVAGLLAFGKSFEAQSTTGGQEQITSAKTASGSAGSAAAPPGSVVPAGAQTGAPASKQSELALETDKLVAMAAELKARVDKTNKDILSLEVVQQAQAIEQYAHQMKQGSVRR
jgi:hypothetical protein